MNQNSNEYIKTFLKIEKTEEDAQALFSVDKNHKIFSLYSSENKKLDFEYDKIFIDTDENPYIYKIISQNCIEEFIKGTNYCFISYGESVNKKFETLVGDIKENYSNNSDYGILVRFMDELLIKMNEIENYNSIKFSNFMILENILIDLTYFGGKNKKGYEIDSNILLSNAYQINSDSNIINKMNIINVDKFNDLIKYLHHIHKFLSKLNKENIYNKSNICFIIYLFDKISNKIISTMSFIILLGSENLYGKSTIKINNDINLNNNNKSIKAAKSSIETRYIFNSIINSISNNIYINEMNNKQKSNEEFESKLTTVLNNICFNKNISNIKFRIIGNIRPIKGYYQYTKDVLIFLFDCWKILNSQIEEKKEVKDNSKERITFELEFKIKDQKNEINNLNRQIEKLHKKIEFLDCNYQKQISVLKNYFEFDGDINVLLSGNENTKEMKYVKSYKNYQNIIHDCQESQKNLEKNLEESKNEIDMLKTKLNSRKEQQDMINYYLSAQNAKISSINNSGEKHKFNILSKQIEELNQKIKSKDKIISLLQKELDKKTKMILTISKTEMDTKNESKIKSKNISENKMTEFSFKQELENMKFNEEKNLKEIKNKYNSMLFEKKEELYQLKKNIESIKIDNNNIKTELINIYELFMDFISFIGKNRKNSNKNSEELEQMILDINNKINNRNYPNLLQELKEKNKTKFDLKEMFMNDKSKNLEIKNEDDKDIKLSQELSEINDRAKDLIIKELKEKNKLLSLTFDLQIKKNNNNLIIINSQKRTIEKLELELSAYRQIMKNKKNLSDNILTLNIDFKDSKIIRKSFSFNKNDVLKIQKPCIIKRNKKLNDIYNYDSFKDQTKNSSNINNYTSSQSKRDKINYNNKKVKELILIQKRINKVSKNKRPFSVSNEVKNNFIFETK